MHLTKQSIEKLAYTATNGKRDIRWDDETRGLGLRIYPSNRKAFVLSYRIHSRKRLITLGNFGELTPDQARKIALKKLNQILEGIDPLNEKKRANNGDSISDLCTAYIERHAKAKKKSWTEDCRRIEKNILPEWRQVKLSSITHSDVASLHGKLGKRAPYEANRTLALLSKMFKLAQKWGMLPFNSINPAQGIDRFPERSRGRYITPEELPKFVQAINEERSPYVKAAIWLYLTTGLRKNELLSAKWDNVDFTRNELYLKDTKNRESLRLPLSSAAISILKDIPKIEGNPFILPGHKTGHPLVNISKPWSRIRNKAQIPDVRIHDLRRTVGSWLAQSGQSLQTIGKILNHSNLATTEIYARIDQRLTREALEAHGNKILNFAKTIPPETKKKLPFS